MSNKSDFLIEDGILKKYLGKEKKVIIPKGVKKIGYRAFRKDDKEENYWEGNDNVEVVIIPDGVLEIDGFAFANCHKLTEVSIADSVEIIHDDAFKWCENLQKVIFPKNLKKIGNRAFQGCKKIEKICIPEGTEIIGAAAFYFCTSLKEVIFPKSIEIIGGSAFYGCFQLTKVEIQPVNYFLEINSKAFGSCDRLKDVILPIPVDCKIANDAFSYVTKIFYRDK